MANKHPLPAPENLMPPWNSEKARIMGRKGGKKSQEVVRKKKTIQESIRMLLESKPVTPEITKKLEELGVEPQDINNATGIAVSMLNQSYKGNIQAAKLCLDVYNGSSDEQLIKIKQEELRIKQEQHQIEMEEYNRRKNADQAPRYNGIPALAIAPSFLAPLFDIANHRHTEYVFDGGRGSTKSSFISETIVDLIVKNQDMNALIMRQVSNTIRGTVYNQIVWAIDYLGITDDFHCTASPCEITRISTGQKIFFRGADDEGKIKSIKPPRGYIGILWFEELDQFNGPESIRKIEQSAIRGGDIAYIFKSFNPPKSAMNWANKEMKIPKPNRLLHHSNYLDVPQEWLGKAFIEEAEFLKEINPTAYDNEYMGQANGMGGNVFDNVIVREITDDEIKQFDRNYHGVDWGWFPDPYDYSKCYYDPARLALYIFAEYRCNKKSNRETADILLNEFNVGGELVTCDSAENKSIEDYRTYGIAARGAEKGPNSVEYSMKWLASLREIVIDPVRCPYAADEFINYEYDRDKDGNIITGYPDKNNHAIDSVRYATNSVWKKRGQ